MILGALLQATAYARAHIIVARIVSGCGLGVINSTVPVFQSEFSPKASRGLCMLISHSRLCDVILMLSRCLHATVNLEFRHHTRVLDRLCFLHPRVELCLAHTRDLAMRLPRPNALHDFDLA